MTEINYASARQVYGIRQAYDRHTASRWQVYSTWQSYSKHMASTVHTTSKWLTGRNQTSCVVIYCRRRRMTEIKNASSRKKHFHFPPPLNAVSVTFSSWPKTWGKNTFTEFSGKNTFNLSLSPPLNAAMTHYSRGKNMFDLSLFLLKHICDTTILGKKYI